MLRRLTVVAVLALSGCRDECDPAAFTSTCEEKVAVTCPEPGVDQVVPVRIRRKECEDACVVVNQGAFCALSTTPEPKCDGGSDDRCDNATTRFYCSSGYATGRTDCKACVARDAGSDECEGGPASKCTSNPDCAASLICKSNGYCGSP